MLHSCGRKWWRMLIWTNQRHFSITCTWDALNVIAHRTNHSSNNIKRCSSHVFLLGVQHNFLDCKNLMQKPLHGPTIWKDMLKSAWKDNANWRKRRQSNITKFPVFAWMIIHARRKNWNQLELSEVRSQMVLKCFYLVRLADRIFYGQWTNLHDLSQNGHKRVTDNWQYWYLTFITRVSTVNIVMWETRLSFADWVYSKNLILLANLRIRNVPRVCIFGSRTFVTFSWMCKKANVSISWFYRIWNSFVGCWIANGWITCSRSMGCCDRSTVFHEQYSSSMWKQMRDRGVNHKTRTK